MEIRAWSRGSGKTQSLILQSELTGAVIVVANQRASRTVQLMAKLTKHNIPKPVTITELLCRKVSLKPETHILIDELFMVLAVALAPYQIDAVTFSETIGEKNEGCSNYKG